MFKSIHYLEYLGYDPKTKLYYSYLFKIIDEYFEEEIATAGLGVSEAVAIINCYSKRNLSVPKNLLLLFQYYEKEYGKSYNSIEQQISLCDKHQPLFSKYKEDVEKYLLLI